MTLSGIIFIVGILIFLFFPAIKDVNTLSSDVLDAQTELEAQYSNRKNLLDSITKVSQIRKTTEALKSQFLSPGDELLFIQRIEELAVTHNVEASITISEVRSKNDSIITEKPFGITLGGTYPNVLSALRSIERLPNMTFIHSVYINAGDVSEDETTVISTTVNGILIFTPEGL